ncbi:hypothetical protein [Streptomyces sp. A1547]|uniref:hypothetical protein n=1 Tax=Streptomyces sp. A1547 TaxID=2563105 RepID=UPI00109ECAC5|nr:hypothetical protein [Streptomyces sp. A1547]THA37807.1 hypothetical protein E6W17_19765 [Streptomyces sp. A1547]
MTESQLPDWTDQKMATKVRTALWLATEVGEGNVYTKEQLRAAFPDVTQIDRRVRELRDYGWVIATNRDDPRLTSHEARFVQAGDPVWEPGARARTLRERRALAPLHSASVERVQEFRLADAIRVHRPQDPEAVWERLKDLSQEERSLILAWIAMGRRPSSPAELAWRAFRGLSEQQRREMAARLGELVSSELYEELPVAEECGDDS